MARTGWSNTNFLRYSGAVVGAYPFTIACWVNFAASPVGQANIIGIFNSGAALSRDSWILHTNASLNPIFRACDSVGNSNATAGTNFTTSTWHHICGVGASATDRACFINGGSKGTSVTSRSPAGLDRTSFAKEDNSAGGNSLASGVLVAEAAIWGASLSDSEVSILAERVSPLLIRPASLISYFPLLGIYGPEIDVKSGFGAVIQGSLAAGPHPPMIYSASTRFTFPRISTSSLVTTLPRMTLFGVGS